jgi:pimeloyl-ACP methyl ester carboxylesterase
MPFARAKDGTRLFYEVAGDRLTARAVLLVMGLGLRGELWGETRDALAAAGYRVLTMDNRGVGDSRVASLGLTTATMADDAVAVIRHASATRAHIVGTSLGGMVAQQLALRHADRVEALVLQSTTAGMPRLDFVPRSGLARVGGLFRARITDLSPEERARAALRLLTTDAYARTARLEDPRLAPLLAAIEAGVSPVGYLAQVRAAWKHRAWKDLHRITAPTLVQHGAEDQLVSARAARAIVQRISGARLEVYDRAGHLLALERPDSIGAVRAFLGACERRAVA